MCYAGACSAVICHPFCWGVAVTQMANFHKANSQLFKELPKTKCARWIWHPGQPHLASCPRRLSKAVAGGLNSPGSGQEKTSKSTRECAKQKYGNDQESWPSCCWAAGKAALILHHGTPCACSPVDHLWSGPPFSITLWDRDWVIETI